MIKMNFSRGGHMPVGGHLDFLGAGILTTSLVNRTCQTPAYAALWLLACSWALEVGWCPGRGKTPLQNSPRLPNPIQSIFFFLSGLILIHSLLGILSNFTHHPGQPGLDCTVIHVFTPGQAVKCAMLCAYSNGGHGRSRAWSRCGLMQGSPKFG